MNKTVVINAVGLSESLLGPATPRLLEFARQGSVGSIGSVIPAVTTTVQSTYLTGTWPAEHGAVANGWYFRDECEIKFWKQANPLVQRPKIWDMGRQRDAAFSCANICWWYAMYSSADFTVTPRPMYPADGRKLPDCWTHPPELRDSLQQQLGQFPLFNFWGPATSIKATQWIADAAMKVDATHHPTLSLIYLPHLDYVLQKVGPADPTVAKDLGELDTVIGQLLDHFLPQQAQVIILSEYGITAVDRPVHLNRVLREKGLLAVRDELAHELLDPGESVAFAVADHQFAHVYVNDPARVAEVKSLLEAVDGVERVLDAEGKQAHHLDHPRSGELVAIAKPGAWFTYYYWLDEARAPDFARTVDIHRKPGYDPVELFLDPTRFAPKLKIAATLLKRKLGFRAMMDVIGTDATLVKGSHGRAADHPSQGPIFITQRRDLRPSNQLEPTAVCETILRHVFEQPVGR